jgi:hypothetical protein
MIVTNKLRNANVMIQENLGLWGWRNMVEQGIVKTKDTLRVEFNEDGTVNLLDFSMPSMNGRERHNVPQEDLATWIIQTASMLRITKDGELVPHLGFKVSDNLYYMINREGESDE